MFLDDVVLFCLCKRERVLPQKPVVQKPTISKHATPPLEQDLGVDPLSEQIKKLQQLQQRQQLQQLKQLQMQLLNPCDSTLNPLQAAIQSLQQQVAPPPPPPHPLKCTRPHERLHFAGFKLKRFNFINCCKIQLNQIQLLAQNVPTPATCSLDIEVSPAVFMLGANARTDGETKGREMLFLCCNLKNATRRHLSAVPLNSQHHILVILVCALAEQIRTDSIQALRQTTQPQRPSRQQQRPECEQKENLNDFPDESSLWHEDCPPGFECSRTFFRLEVNQSSQNKSFFRRF